MQMQTLLLIDAGLADLDILMSGLNPGVVPFVVQPDQDALAVLEAALSTTQTFEDLTVVAHGNPGEVLIGREPITKASLSNRSATWASLTGTSIGSIHLFACHAGQDQAFLDGLSSITGCDVAAADKTIGHANLGAVWQLDVVATPAEGVATAPSNGLVPFTRIAREAWCHRLVTTYTVAQANLLSGGTAYNLADSASNLAAASSSLLNGSGTITLTGTSALAADLNTLDGKTTKSVDAASLTDWTGTAAAVLTALNSSGIDGLGNEAVTLTGTTTVADANSANAAISGQPVTATIREQDMASLAGLTPTGAGVGAQPYTITVSDATVAASALNTLDGKTSVAVNASSITRLTGTAEDVLSAYNRSGGITGLGNEAVALSGSTTVADANSVNGFTSGVVTSTITEGNLATLTTLTGTGNAYTITVTDTTAAATDLNSVDAKTTVNLNANNVTTLTGAAADIAIAISASTITTAVSVGVTISAGSVAASDLNTIDSNTSATVNATAVTAINGLVADVKTAIASAGINTSTTYSSTLSDTSVSVANANSVDADTTGVVTATITEGNLATLTTLTGTGNAYTITVADTTAAATDLNSVDAKTTVNLNANNVITLTGTAADIAIAISASTITTAAAVGVTISAGAVAASDLNTIDLNTSPTVNATAATAINGLVADVKTAIASAGINTSTTYSSTLSDTSVSVANANSVDADTTGVVTATIAETAISTLGTLSGTGNAYTISVSDSSVDAAALNTLDGKTTVTVNAGSVGMFTGSAGDIATAISTTTIDTAAAVIATVTGSATVAQANTIDTNTTGVVTTTITETTIAALSGLNTSTGNAYTISVSDSSVDAAALNTLDGKTTVNVNAGSVGTLTGSAAAIDTAINAATIDTAAAVLATVTGSATVAQANTIDTNTTGVVTATITETTISALSGLNTSTGNAYTITLSETSAAASALNTLDGKTTVALNAASVTTLTGTAADVNAAYTANTAGTITGLGNEAVTLSDTSLTATVLNTVNSNTSGVVNAASVTTLTGLLADVNTAYAANTANTISGLGDETVTITNSGGTLLAIDLTTAGNATSGTVTVTNGQTVTGTVAEVTAALVTASSKVVMGSASTATVSNAATAAEGAPIATTANITASFSSGISDTLANLANSGSISSNLSSITTDQGNVVVTIADAAAGTFQAADLSAVGNATTGAVSITNSQTVNGTADQVIAADVTSTSKVNLNSASTLNASTYTSQDLSGVATSFTLNVTTATGAVLDSAKLATADAITIGAGSTSIDASSTDETALAAKTTVNNSTTLTINNYVNTDLSGLSNQGTGSIVVNTTTSAVLNETYLADATSVVLGAAATGAASAIDGIGANGSRINLNSQILSVSDYTNQDLSGITTAGTLNVTTATGAILESAKLATADAITIGAGTASSTDEAALAAKTTVNNSTTLTINNYVNTDLSGLNNQGTGSIVVNTTTSAVLNETYLADATSVVLGAAATGAASAIDGIGANGSRINLNSQILSVSDYTNQNLSGITTAGTLNVTTINGAVLDATKLATADSITLVGINTAPAADADTLGSRLGGTANLNITTDPITATTDLSDLGSGLTLQFGGDTTAVVTGVTLTVRQDQVSGYTISGTGTVAAAGTSGADTFNASGITATTNFTSLAGADSVTIAPSALGSVDVIDSGADTDTLIFSAAASVVDVAFTNVSSVEILQLAAGTNSITLGVEAEQAGITTVTGNTGADTLNLLYGTAGLTFNAAGGADTLSYSADSTAQAITLSIIASNAASGSVVNNGTDSFTGLEAIVGGSGTADSITSTTAAEALIVTGANAGTIDSFSFSGVESVNLGDGNDTGTINTGGSLSGSLNFGGGTADSLTYAGYGSALSSTLSGSNTLSSVTAITGGVSGVENITLSSNNDTLTIGGSGSLSGNVDFGTGSDTLTYAGNANAVTVSLNSATSTAAAGATGITGTTIGFETLIGGSGSTDTLNATSGVNSISVASGGTTTLASSLTVSGFETINLGASADANADTATVSGAFSGTIDLGDGTDTATINNGGSVNSLAGGIGTDTLNLDSANQAITVTGTGAGTSAGSSGGTTTFSGFETVNGLAGDDAFTINSASASTITIDGGTDTDSLSVASSDTAANSLTLSAPGGGTLGGVSFANVDNVTLGSGSDSITLASGGGLVSSAPGLLADFYNESGNGTDIGSLLRSGVVLETVNVQDETLQSLSIPSDHVYLYAQGFLTVPGSGTYNDFILSTTSDDGVRVKIDLAGTGTFSNVINNWTTHGDVIDYSPSQSVTAGQRIPIQIEWFDSGGGATLELYYQSSSQGINRTLVPLSNLSSGTQFSSTSGILDLGSGNDNVVFQPGTFGVSSLIGGAGTDTLNYSSYGSAVTVNLATGTATGTGGISSIETVLGSSGADNLTASSSAVENLQGNAGADTFNVTVAGLTSADTIDGGADSDTLVFTDAGVITDAQFTNVTTLETVNLTGASTISAGTEASQAGIATINTGTGATTVNSTATGYDLTVNAANLADNASLTLTGSANTNDFTVTNLTGSVLASGTSGTLAVTTGDAADNTIGVTTGSGATTLTANGSGDTVTTNAAALAQNTLLSFFGAARQVVTNLVGNLTGANLSGTLNVTTANAADDGITITTGSGNVLADGGDATDIITVTGLNTDNQTLNAQASTANFNITAGANNQTITGSNTGSDTIDGGAGADTLSYAGGSNVDVTISSYSTQAGGSTGQGTDSFSSIENLGGATGNDILRGTAATTDEVVTVTGANTGTIQDSASTGSFSFSSFEQLDLQGGNDTLTVNGNTSGVSLSGSAELGSGNNTLSMEGSAGSIAALSSGTGNDTFTITAGSVTGAVSSGDGSNTVTISGTNSSIGSYTGGSGTDSVTLSGGDVQGNVSTGTGDDTLLINITSSTVNGNLDLGGGTGDTLSYGGPNAAIGATFDGSTSYAAYINEPETSVSREFVFSTTSGGALFSIDNSGSGSTAGVDRTLTITSDGNVNSRVWNDEILQSTGLNLTDGNTHRLVFTLGSGGTNIYVDGVRVLHGNLTASAFNWDVYQKIGFSPQFGGSFFNGTIDSYRTWNTELTADQAKGLAALPAPVHAFEFNNNTTDTGSSPVTLTLVAGTNSYSVLPGSGYTNAVSVTLSDITNNTGSTDAGGATSITGTATGFETLEGGSNNTDTITDATGDSTLAITGANSGTLDGMAFSTFENLNLSGGNDTATVSGNGSGLSLYGNLDLGEGTNSLTMNGSAGTVGSVNSGTGNDTFSISAGSVIGAVSAGDGSNALTISGTSSSIGSYVGGTGTDSITLSGGDVVGDVSTSNGNDNVLISSTDSTIGGNLNLEIGDSDTLSYAGYTNAVSVILTGITNNAGNTAAGGATAISGIASGFESLIGGTNSGDTVTDSTGDSTIVINGANSGTIDGMAFSAVENLSLSNGIDGVTVQTGGSLGGNLNLGDGTSNTLTMASGAGAIGSVTSTSGNDTFTLDGGSVTGAMTAGDGTNSLTINNTASTIGSYTGGSGIDTIDSKGGDILGAVNTGSSADSVTLSLGATITGAVTLGANSDSSDGKDSLSLDASSITGAVNTGSGADEASITNASTLTGDLTLGVNSDSADGADSLTVTGASSSSKSVITGSITTGGGADEVKFTDATIGAASQTLSLGSDNNSNDGNDSLTATRTGITATLTTGSGSDTVTLSDSSSLIGDVTLGTAGDTTNGNTDTLTLNAASITGNVTTGSGADAVNVLTTSTITGNVTLGTSGDAQDGADTLTVTGTSSSSKSVITGNITTGAGVDTLTLTDATIGIAGQTIALGLDSSSLDGNDRLNASGTTIKASITGGSGADTVSLSAASSVEGAITLGIDGDTLTASNADSLTLDASSVTGNVSTGSGTDAVSVLSTSTITGNVTLGSNTDSSDGADTLTVTGVSSTSKSVITGSISTGAGVDTLTLTNATIGGANQTISLGSDTNGLDGNDSLSASGTAITAAITTGSGSDSLTLSADSSVFGDVTLGSVGDNQAIINYANSVTDTFGSAIGWTGGTIDSTNSYYGSILGRYAVGGTKTNGQDASQTFSLNGLPATISFDFIKLDSWDGESFKAYINDIVAYSGNFYAGQGIGSASGVSNGFNWTIAPKDSLAHRGFAGWEDQTATVTIALPAGYSNLKFGFGSTLNQDIGDESYAIDNFSIISSIVSHTDSLSLDASSITGNVTTGSGADTASVVNTSTITGDITLGSNTDSSDGADTLTVTGASSSSKSVITGSISTGAGADTLTLTDATIGGQGKTISLGSDNNRLDGNDRLSASGTAITSSITTGSGSDELSLTGSSVSGNVSLGADGDTFIIDSSRQSITDSFSSASGWTNGTVDASSSYYGSLLGRYANGSKTSGQDTSKSFDLGGSATTLAFDLARIDNWNGELFKVYVDDTVAFEKGFTTSDPAQVTGVFEGKDVPSSNPAYTGKFNTPANGGEMPWWGNETMARDVAISNGTSLGTFATNYGLGPIFAFGTHPNNNGRTNVYFYDPSLGQVRWGGDGFDKGTNLFWAKGVSIAQPVGTVVSGTNNGFNWTITTKDPKGAYAGDAAIQDQTFTVSINIPAGHANTKIGFGSTIAQAVNTQSYGIDNLSIDSTIVSNTDTLSLDASSITGNVSTGSGADTVTLSNSSTVTGNVTLGNSGDGQDGNDSLTLSSGSKIAGNVDFGAGNDTLTLSTGISSATTIIGDAAFGVGNSDTLSYIGNAGPITVALDGISADAVGTATCAKASYTTGNVTGFEAIVGSDYTTPTSDSVTGDTIYDNTGASLVVLTGANTGTIDNLDFSSIENLQLRSGADTLSFQGTSGAPGSIAGLADGGGIEGASYTSGVYSGGTKTDDAIDLLDYTSYQASSGATVDLSKNQATGIYSGQAGGLISGDGSIATTTTDSSFENVDGSRFNDTITGDDQTSQGNILRGFGGSDTIKGLAGNDIIDGGNGVGSNINDGADTIEGGDGADTIIASFGNDTISGGTVGTASDQWIDTLTYSATAISSARIEGLDISLAGTDTGTVAGDAISALSVSTFKNTYNPSINQQLITAPTNQVSKDWTQSYTDIQNLVLSEQSDILRIDSTDVNSGSIDAKGGSLDTLDYSSFGAASPVLVNLSAATYSFDFDANGTIDTTVGEITISNKNSATNVMVTTASSQGGENGVSGFEAVIGGAADDAIVGNASDNLLVGNAGDDRIAGGAGNDTIYGGTGDDYITPGQGSDYVVAGAGINTIAITSSDLAQDTFNVDPNGINVFALQGNGTSANSSSIDAPTGNWDPGSQGLDLLDGGKPVVDSSGVTVYDTIEGTATADTYQFGGVAFKNIGNVDLDAGDDTLGTAATTKGVKVNYDGGSGTDSVTLNLTFAQFAKLNASGLYVADVQNYLDNASGKTFSSSQADFTASSFETGGVAVITPGVFNALQGDPAATTFNSAYGLTTSTITSGNDVNLSASALTTSTATALSAGDIVSAFVQASGVKGSDAISVSSGGSTTGSTTASQDANAVSRTVDDRADSVLSAYSLGTDRSSFTAGDSITLTLSGNVKADTTAESLGFVVNATGTVEAAGSRDSSLAAGDALSLSITGTAAQTVAASTVDGLALAALASRTYGIDDANLTDTSTDSVQAGADLSLQATASSSNRVTSQTVGTESLGTLTLVNNGAAATDRFTITQIGAVFPLINGDRVRFTTSNGSVQADRDYYVANVIPVTGEFQLSSEPNGDPINIASADDRTNLQAYRPAVATADAISTVTGVDLNRTVANGSGVQAGEILSLRASAADAIAATATSVAGDATAGVFRLGGMDGLNLAAEVSIIQALADTASLAGNGASLSLTATDSATLMATSADGAALTEANIQVFGAQNSASTAGDDLNLSTQAALTLSGSASSTAGSAEARSGAGAGAGVATAGVTNVLPTGSSYSVVTGLADGTQTAAADLAVEAKAATALNATASTVSGAETLSSLWTSATGNILATFDLNLNTTTSTPSFVGPQYLAAGQLVQLDTTSATAAGLAPDTDYAVKLLGFGAVDASNTGSTPNSITMPTGITSYAVNDAVRFRLNSRTAPNSSDSRYGLALGTTYYVKSVSGTTFTLSTSTGGPVIDLSADSEGPADQLVDADRFQLLTLPTAPGGSYAVAPVTASVSGVSLTLPAVANAFAGSREADRTLNNSDSLNLAQVSGISGNAGLRGLIAGAQNAITAMATGVLNAVARNTANDATASAGLVAEGLSDTAISAGSAGTVMADATITAVADAATTGNNALIDNALADLTVTARGLTASNTANDISIGGVGDVQATASLAGSSSASTVLGDSDALAALKATGLEALSNGFTATIGQQGDFSAAAVVGTAAAPLLVEAISAASGDATVQAASTAISILGSYTAPGFSSLQAGAAQGDISGSASADLNLRAIAVDGAASVSLGGVGGAGTADIFGIKDMALTTGADFSQINATALGQATLLAQTVELDATSVGSTSVRGLFSSAAAALPVSFSEDGRIGAIAQQSSFAQSISVNGNASTTLSNESLGIGNAAITIDGVGTLDASAISHLDNRAQSVSGAASA